MFTDLQDGLCCVKRKFYVISGFAGRERELENLTELIKS